MGAGQPVLTTLMVLLILVFVYLFLSNNKINQVLEYNLIIDRKTYKLQTVLYELEAKLETLN